MSQNPQVTLFKYVTGGQEVTFLDDQGLYDAETIRKHWQGTFPELGNCQAETVAKKQMVAVEGREVEIDRLITYVKKVGTKGSGDADRVDETNAAALPSIADQVRAWEIANEEAQAKAALGSVQAVMTEAWAIHNDPARKRLIDAAPRMLAELEAQRDLLKTLLEVVVFLHGNRQVVIDRLARLEAVIREASGEQG